MDQYTMYQGGYTTGGPLVTSYANYDNLERVIGNMASNIAGLEGRINMQLEKIKQLEESLTKIEEILNMDLIVH